MMKTNIRVIDTATGEIFESIKSAAQSLNMTPIKLGNQLRGVTPNKTTIQYLKKRKKMKKFKSVHSEAKGRLIYPVLWKNKLWKEQDCHYMFVCFYNDRAALTDSGCVYVSEGEYVFPDGSTIEY